MATDGGSGDPFHTGELSVLGRVSIASNLTLVCEIGADGQVRTDGRTAAEQFTAVDASLRVVYKPVRGERPLWDFPDGTLAGREVASYRVSQSLGWGVIPETILREGPLGPGMVQRWVESVDSAATGSQRLDLVDLVPIGAVPDGFREVLRAVDGTGSEVSLVHADDPRLRRMAVLDVLLNNADRKGGHALEGVDGAVYGVDHGICLHAEPKLRTVLWGWAGEPIEDELLADIGAFVKALPGALGDELADHLTDAEIEALGARGRRLLDHPVMPLPEGARPIPWPAF
ncbi:putative repeat protein (TIGR03843 family) [Nocardia transvalensis]|uniref:Putative repeat protein (TIGR03843 family) n=1 Tax=Nocardia transvalensis TaxID=37333 RepID=A0A7W9PJ91_9NOCA|nr:SCO1664 family protein [Nocardia transvalensis]MBB5916493.1 putative repeat protein (TIGR03843 family) [Nocardia transvalensis]